MAHDIGRAGVNFTNILLATFSYESIFRSFSLVTVWLCNFFDERISVPKLLLNVDKIDRRQ